MIWGNLEGGNFKLWEKLAGEWTWGVVWGFRWGFGWKFESLVRGFLEKFCWVWMFAKILVGNVVGALIFRFLNRTISFLIFVCVPVFKLNECPVTIFLLLQVQVFKTSTKQKVKKKKYFNKTGGLLSWERVEIWPNLRLQNFFFLSEVGTYCICNKQNLRIVIFSFYCPKFTYCSTVSISTLFYLKSWFWYS